MNQLFTDFPPISKADWLEKIQKDLKGKAPSDFDWMVADGQPVTAFPHLDDMGGALPHPISEGKNDWQICEAFQVGDAAKTNKMALKALEGGADALRFNCTEVPDFEALMSGIDLNIINLHLRGKKMEQPVSLLRKLVEYAGPNATLLNGTFCWQGKQPMEILELAEAQLPGFKVLPVHGSAFYEKDETTVAELNKMAQAANDWFAKLTTEGVGAERIAKQMFFTCFIGKNYFLQIAKLRAIRKFWQELQLKCGVENPQPAFIFAQFPISDQSPDANTNLIQSTTQAMSAVIGGVDVLTVLPSDKISDEAKPTDFSRRMARNVQHILKLESHFDWVSDPAAGSYFIEKLTSKLLENMEV
ncbi:MAG: methylmalonyl-CoA mutase family protein [Saprospiraceae bacterium]|nr:methylmalonyl-CoA mutase family protein [Saprospiraceae bacterium]